MSRTILPLHVGDLSAFAKALRHQLEGFDELPGHVEMLNLLCKACGYRNFQHFRAEQEALPATADATPPETGLQPPRRPAQPEINVKWVKEVVRHFDADGRLVRWPKKFSLRLIALWVMWSRIPARTALSEPEINELLAGWNGFEDHALLRRELADRGMVERTADGRQYRRIEAEPPADAVEVIRLVRPQRQAA